MILPETIVTEGRMLPLHQWLVGEEWREELDYQTFFAVRPTVRRGKGLFFWCGGRIDARNCSDDA